MSAEPLSLSQNGSAKMRFVVRPLRLALLMCIFAAFPASGQVDDGAESSIAAQSRAQEKRALEALDRVPDQVVRAAPDLRLVASEPRLDDVPRLSVPALADRRVDPGPAEAIVPRREAAAADLAEQPVALVAVPAVPPPADPAIGREPVNMQAAASSIRDMLQGSWQQAALVIVLAVGCIWLFWRLGQRSRLEMAADPAPELGLTEAMIDQDEIWSPAGDSEAALIATLPAAAAPLPMPASHVPTDLTGPRDGDEEILLLDGSEAPQFDTFHAAIAAMKAEMARSASFRDQIDA